MQQDVTKHPHSWESDSTWFASFGASAAAHLGVLAKILLYQ